MRIPKQIRIGRQVWRVVRERRRARRTLQQQGLDGVCIPSARVIVLSRHLRGNALAHTFLHELLHAVVSSRRQVVSWRTEEKIVSILAPTLLQVIRDNRLFQVNP